jgi:hypothetical protein
MLLLGDVADESYKTGYVHNSIHACAGMKRRVMVSVAIC